ncbi:MAG: circularly permuted type 2 ATP-grasp protein [Kiritimatiellae bacterium]|jgi:uncharacterized circularly permuted ATP-grasp superfamily protein/uncharacterized alpha-E superfamily protein|nr:circularly permuted type 2 ATP-grasp protein [Kiritimatiellia bacterium]
MIATSTESLERPPRWNRFDESVGADGAFLPSWKPFLGKIQSSSVEDRTRWREVIRRDMREDGLTFTLSQDVIRTPPREELNPVPWIFSTEQWQPVEAGVSQRARLLAALARDLLGPRTLIRRGVLPAELLFSDPAYLKPCIDLPPNMESWLFQYSVDVARGPDGRFWILEDRTQAPSGSGIALESRTIMGGVFPQMLSQMQVRRLAPYFRKLRESMLSMYQGRPLEPRVVLMTPGPYSSSYFEHAYLAAYLGYTLVQGSDLLVRNGALKLKTLEGLQPVDIVLRQLDAEYLDPLELKRDSYLGVPGLLGAMRTGRAAVLNHPGCGVLENAGLMAFFPMLSRELLGEELLLPSLATWWCGQRKECDYVLSHLRELMIKPLHRYRDESAVDGRLCSESELADLKARIRARPESYVGQEQMEFSSLPTLVGNTLETRTSVMRAFAFASGSDYEVMPGGLARSARETDGGTIGLDTKGWIKDVWVLGDQPEPHHSLWLEKAPPPADQWFSGVFTSRTGENLFWVGRYAERLTRQARLLRGMIQLEDVNFEAHTASPPELSRMVDLMDIYGGRLEPNRKPALLKRVQNAISGRKETGSMKKNLRGLLVAAYTVRDIWSQDSWRTLSTIETTGELCFVEDPSPFTMERELSDFIEKLNAFYGLNANGMTRESGWSMLMLGRVLESGIGLCELMKGLLEPVNPGEAISYGLMELALQQNENLITYRRHYRTTPQLRSVLALMTASEVNPRSLVFYLEYINAYVDKLPPPVQSDVIEPLVLDIKRIRSRLLQTEMNQPDPDGGLSFLQEVRACMETVSTVVSSAYFSHTALQARENF